MSSRAASAPNEKWRWVALCCFSGLLAAMLARHEFWRDEVHAWNIAVYAGSFGDIYQRMVTEGHPALWYLVLRMVGMLSRSPQAMLPLQWVLASSTAATILWCCPLPRWQRLCCCFGYFLLFEYGVICREYSTGILLLILAAAVCSRRPRAVITPAILLGLALHASPFAALVAIPLFCWVMIDRRGQPGASWFIAVGLFVVSGLALAAYMHSDVGDSVTPAARVLLRPGVMLGKAKSIMHAAMPVPPPDNLHFWNINWTESISSEGLRRALQYAVSLGSLVLGMFSLVHRRGPAVVYLTGSVLIFGLIFTRTEGFLRYEGHWFVLFFLCHWLDWRPDVGEGVPEASRVRSWQRKIRVAFPAFLFAVQPVAALVPVVRSFDAPFSPTAGLVRQVAAAGFGNAPRSLGIASDEVSLSLLVTPDRPAYSPAADRFLYFSVESPGVEPATAMHRLAGLVGREKTVAVFVTREEVAGVRARLPSSVAEVREFTGRPGIVRDDPDVCLILRAAR